MNLFKFGRGSWIIIVNLTLLITLLTMILSSPVENYVNYPQQVNPMAQIQSNPELNTANNNYAALMLFLQKNPQSSAKFIADIKQKFFSDECTVKPNIDFPNIAKMPSGLPFS